MLKINNLFYYEFEVSLSHQTSHILSLLRSFSFLKIFWILSVWGGWLCRPPVRFTILPPATKQRARQRSSFFFLWRHTRPCNVREWNFSRRNVPSTSNSCGIASIVCYYANYGSCTNNYRKRDISSPMEKSQMLDLMHSYHPKRSLHSCRPTHTLRIRHRALGKCILREKRRRDPKLMISKFFSFIIIEMRKNRQNRVIKIFFMKKDLFRDRLVCFHSMFYSFSSL